MGPFIANEITTKKINALSFSGVRDGNFFRKF